MKPVDKDTKKDEDRKNQPPNIAKVSKKQEQKKFDGKKVGAILARMPKDKKETEDDRDLE